jgi:hypothetical protein
LRKNDRRFYHRRGRLSCGQHRDVQRKKTTKTASEEVHSVSWKKHSKSRILGKFLFSQTHRTLSTFLMLGIAKPTGGCKAISRSPATPCRISNFS